MAKMYDLVKGLLSDEPFCRDNDKRLIWRVWEVTSSIWNSAIGYEDFLRAATPESITRARRKVQEDHPYLRASKQVERARKAKARKYKGMHAYHENTDGRLL